MIVYLLDEPMHRDAVHSLTAGSDPACVLHRRHTPRPLRLVAHHVWPLAHGGPSGSENLAIVCDTGHYSVHEVLRILLAGKPLPPRFGTRTEREMARRGYVAIRAASSG